MISKSLEELVKLVPKQNNSDNSSNNDLLLKIQSGNTEIVKSIENLKALKASFIEGFSKLNFTQEIINGKKNNISAEKIFEIHEAKLLYNFKDLVCFTYFFKKKFI